MEACVEIASAPASFACIKNASTGATACSSFRKALPSNCATCVEGRLILLISRGPGFLQVVWLSGAGLCLIRQGLEKGLLPGRTLPFPVLRLSTRAFSVREDRRINVAAEARPAHVDLCHSYRANEQICARPGSFFVYCCIVSIIAHPCRPFHVAQGFPFTALAQRPQKSRLPARSGQAANTKKNIQA